MKSINSLLKPFDNKLESPFIMNPSRFASGAVGGWKELGRTTLGAGNSTITVSSLADKRYYKILVSGEHTSGNNTRLRFNSGSNYANRYCKNGGTDGTEASTTWGLPEVNCAGTTAFQVGYVSNLSSKEKLSIFHTNRHGATGAGTAPERAEDVFKWTNTSDPIDEVSVINEGGNWASGSEVVVLGWDPADTHTTNFWEELASVDLSGGASDTLDSGTFTAKKYLWVQGFVEDNGSAIRPTFRFNSVSTGTPYAARRSVNGAVDATNASANQMYLSDHNSNYTAPCFFNMFIINNSANEKLVIYHDVSRDTAGAGTAPDRNESVGKWAYTSGQITSVQAVNDQAGDFSTNSIIKVWGAN